MLKDTEQRRRWKEGDRQSAYHACSLTEQQEQQTELEGGVSDKSCRHCSLNDRNEQQKTKEEGESTEHKTKAVCLLFFQDFMSYLHHIEGIQDVCVRKEGV